MLQCECVAPAWSALLKAEIIYIDGNKIAVLLFSAQEYLGEISHPIDLLGYRKVAIVTMLMMCPRRMCMKGSCTPLSVAAVLQS